MPITHSYGVECNCQSLKDHLSYSNNKVCHDALTEHTRLIIVIVIIKECNYLRGIFNPINALYNNMCTNYTCIT